MSKTIKTLKYGTISIANKDTWLCDEVISEVEDKQGQHYQIRKTLNGQLVALKD